MNARRTGGHSHEVGMSVINFVEASKRLKEAQEQKPPEFVPVTFQVEVTLYEDEYGVKVVGPDDPSAFHELAASMIKVGSKMLMTESGVEVGEPVAYGIVFDNGPVIAYNDVPPDDMAEDRVAWFQERVDDIRDLILRGVERKNSET